jgi:hypothetical protein
MFSKTLAKQLTLADFGWHGHFHFSFADCDDIRNAVLQYCKESNNGFY